MREGTRRNNTKYNFLKIWMRIGIPMLAVTAVVIYLYLYHFMISVELLRGARVERISVELALLLSDTDLTDKAAVEKQFDFLSDLHIIGILFDRDGREIARTDMDQYTDADEELAAQYHIMEETIQEIHAGKDRIQDNEVYAFEPNYWYEQVPVFTPQGTYSLYCAEMTALWQQDGDIFIFIGTGIFAAMVVLTLVIARSYDKLYKKQQAIESAYNQKVNALAHDLKTPMMVISGYSENFLEEIQVEKREHYVERILENVRKMNGIVEEMLGLLP